MKNKRHPNVSPASGEGTPLPGRVLGVYPQKQAGLYMQRVKVLGGRINWPQWRRIAELAETCCDGFPLHLTTRQDLELHNIQRQDVATVHQRLAEVGLTVFGACGDSVRNITVCSGCEFCPGGLDVMPLAQLVRQGIDQEPVIFTLPRKFKISFSGCPKACAKPWLNDLGFIGQPDGRFIVIGAGSLGPRPALGIELYRDTSAGDVLPLCVAAVEMFEKHGDRQNRRRARFRHVRERLGDDVFKAELESRFEQVKARRSWPRVTCGAGLAQMPQQCRLQLPDGNITPAQAVRLADVAEPHEAAVRIDLEHGLVLCGPKPVPLPSDLAALATGPTIVACPGSRTCPRGLTDCWATAAKIRECVPTERLSGARISISGCPNGCAHSAVASIGLVGMLRRIDGAAAPHYQVLAGGGSGTNDIPATLHGVQRAEDIPTVVETLL